MRKRLWLSIALVLIVPAMLFTTSCAKKAVTGTSASKMAQDEAARKAAEKARQEELARKRALEEQRLKEEAAQRAKMEARQQFENEMVHFAFDSAELDATAQDILRRKAAWLRANPDANIIIQGHCDERGTVEYNLALGDRRAKSAKNFLENLGIAASRMTTISYGEERPLDPGHNEQAWAKNRRAQFVIK